MGTRLAEPGARGRHGGVSRSPFLASALSVTSKCKTSVRGTSEMTPKMDGYTKLAALMGNQSEYAMLPWFQAVRALRLVHLSAEIAQLAHELGLVMHLDRSSNDPEKQLFEFYYRKL